MAAIKDRDLVTNLQGALIEAKESLEGKRKMNTLDNLINELRETVDDEKFIKDGYEAG